MKTKNETKIEYLEKLGGQLELQRTTHDDQAKQLAENILPSRIRQFNSDQNRGHRLYGKIIDPAASVAARTGAAGRMSGMSSPARSWFELEHPNQELMKLYRVKRWLADSSEVLRRIMAQSNMYTTLYNVYLDYPTFGTAAFMIEPDTEDVILCRDFPWGSYYIGQDARNRVNIFRRKFQMSVRQIVEEFGMDEKGDIDWTNISDFTKNSYERGHTEVWVDVNHFILPNDDYDNGKSESKYKKFASCYYESGGGGGGVGKSFDSQSTGAFNGGKFLRESGYDYFPVLVARSGLTEGDVYATDSPGMMALGTVKALQIKHKERARAIKKMIDPPMNAAGIAKGTKLSILSGDVNFVPRGESAVFSPAYQFNFDVSKMDEDIRADHAQISRIYHEDTFRMMLDDERAQRATAAEVYAKQQERMLDLGPELERNNQDVFDPAINIIFTLANEAGLLDEPPPELQGQVLRIKYVSVMALAQKASNIGGYERYLGTLSAMAKISPDIMDNMDGDKFVMKYGEMLSVSPEVYRDPEEVAAMRQARAKQMAQKQAVEQIAQGAGAVKDLSQAGMEEDSALTRLTQAANAGRLVNGAA